MARRHAPPRWNRKMQQRLARGEAAALGELYDRFASLVHGLAHRVLGDERAADGITREVFVHVWEHPEAYDPKQGPLRSWVAGLTHRLAVQRLRATQTAAPTQDTEGSTEALERHVRHASGAPRADQRRRATDPAAPPQDPEGSPEELERKARHASVAARADYIVQSMPTP